MFGWLRPRPTLTLDDVLQQAALALQTRPLGELGATHRFMHCLVELDRIVIADGFAAYFTAQSELLAWGACISGLQTIGLTNAAQLVNAATRCHMDMPEDHATLAEYSTQYRALGADVPAALRMYLARNRIAGAA